MTKRRTFIKNTLGFTASAAVAGGDLFGLKSCDSASEQHISPGKVWQSDPEWCQIKYGEWIGPGVPQSPGPMDDVLLKNYAPRSTVVTKRTVMPGPGFK